MIPTNGSSFGRAGSRLADIWVVPRTSASSLPSEDHPEPTRRLTPTDPLDPHRVADPSIQTTSFIPTPWVRRKELPTTEFYSGAASQSGRFR